MYKDKRIYMFFIDLFIVIKTFAIDPMGAKVDYGHKSDSGLGYLLLVFLGIIGVAIYAGVQVYKSNQSNKKLKEKSKGAEIYSQEWLDNQIKQREREDKGATAGCWTFIIICVLMVLYAISNS